MLNAARLIRGYALAMIEANVKRVRSDAIYLPDPKGGLDQWKLVMMRRQYVSSSALFLQVKPCVGAVRHGASALKEIDNMFGSQYASLVREHPPAIVLEAPQDPQSLADMPTTTTIIQDGGEEPPPAEAEAAPIVAHVAPAAAGGFGPALSPTEVRAAAHIQLYLRERWFKREQVAFAYATGIKPSEELTTFESNRLERQYNDLMALKMRGYATMQVLCIAASRMPRLCKAPTRNLTTPDRDRYEPVPLWTQQENGKYNLGLLYANITSAVDADSHRKTWSYRGNAAEAFRRELRGTRDAESGMMKYQTVRAHA